MKSLCEHDNGAFLEDPKAPHLASLVRMMHATDRLTAAQALVHASMVIEDEDLGDL